MPEMAGMAGMGSTTSNSSSVGPYTISKEMSMGLQLQRWQADGIGHPMHGGFNGHVLPGCFFLIWGSWWLFSCYRLYLRSSTKVPYHTRTWFDWPWWPQNVPLEPLAKVLLPFVGINGELWAGHDHYRHLYEPDGRFTEHHLQDWQHSAMYAAVMISGLVDLLGHYTRFLPLGTEQGFLGMAFVVEGLLFAFHLKGTALDFELHLLLVITVFSTALVIFMETNHPHMLQLTALRAMLVLLQGTWFIQVAYILYTENPAWDPEYMGSSMFAPVVYCFWALVLAFSSLCVFVGAKLFQQRAARNYRPVQPDANGWEGTNGSHAEEP